MTTTMMQSVVGLLNGEQGAVPGKSVAGVVKIQDPTASGFYNLSGQGPGGKSKSGTMNWYKNSPPRTYFVP